MREYGHPPRRTPTSSTHPKRGRARAFGAVRIVFTPNPFFILSAPVAAALYPNSFPFCFHRRMDPLDELSEPAEVDDPLKAEAQRTSFATWQARHQKRHRIKRPTLRMVVGAGAWAGDARRRRNFPCTRRPARSNIRCSASMPQSSLTDNSSPRPPPLGPCHIVWTSTRRLSISLTYRPSLCGRRCRVWISLVPAGLRKSWTTMRR